MEVQEIINEIRMKGDARQVYEVNRLANVMIDDRDAYFAVQKMVRLTYSLGSYDEVLRMISSALGER